MNWKALEESRVMKHPMAGCSQGRRLSGCRCNSMLSALQEGDACYCLQLLSNGQALLRNRLLLLLSICELHASPGWRVC